MFNNTLIKCYWAFVPVPKAPCSLLLRCSSLVSAADSVSPQTGEVNFLPVLKCRAASVTLNVACWHLPTYFPSAPATQANKTVREGNRACIFPPCRSRSPTPDLWSVRMHVRGVVHGSHWFLIALLLEGATHKRSRRPSRRRCHTDCFCQKKITHFVGFFLFVLLQTCYKYWCLGVHPRTNTPCALIYKCQACFPSVRDWSLEIVHRQLLQATHLVSMLNFWMARTPKLRSFPSLEVSRFSSGRTVGLNSKLTHCEYLDILLQLLELMLKTQRRSVN